MDIIGIIREKAESAAKSAVKFSGEMVETTKLRFTIMEAEAKISTLTKEIGELVYHSFSGGGDFSEDVKEKCSDITALYDLINETKAKINEMKKVSLCKSCGKKIPQDYAFCPHCGAQCGSGEVMVVDEE